MKYFCVILVLVLLSSVRGLSQSFTSANVEIKIKIIRAELIEIDKLLRKTEKLNPGLIQHHLGKRNVLINSNDKLIYSNVIKNRNETKLFNQSSKKTIPLKDYDNISNQQKVKNVIITVAF